MGMMWSGGELGVLPELMDVQRLNTLSAVWVGWWLSISSGGGGETETLWGLLGVWPFGVLLVELLDEWRLDWLSRVWDGG